MRAALLSARGLLPAEAAEQLERFAELEGRTRAECALLGHLAHLRMDAGRPAAEATELAERAVANERVVAEVGFDAAWLLSCILVLRRAERFTNALRALELGLDSARRRGSEAGFALASTLRASVLAERGRRCGRRGRRARRARSLASPELVVAPGSGDRARRARRI